MEVQCKYSAYRFGDSPDLPYCCEVINIFRNPAVHGVEAVIHGEHQPGKSNEDVTHLRIVSKPVKIFPRNLISFFPNLLEVTIIDCGLETISRQDLVGLENLECLNIIVNQIKSLPDDLFADMRNLREIYFSSNSVEYISSRIFEPIEHTLEEIEFLITPKIDNRYYEMKSANEGLAKFKESIDQTFRPAVASESSD